MKTFKKIVVAFDSFKGCMSAAQACAAATDAIAYKYPDVKVVAIPIADGGEGTAAAVAGIAGAKPCRCNTIDPLSNPITAEYHITDDGSSAVIDTAAASGLTLVPIHKRNALKASTYGTGLLVRNAIERGCRRIYIGLGGSATTDGGTGFLQAIGAMFFTASGELMDPCGESLQHISRIDYTVLNSLLAGVEVIALCDVAAPLYGSNGAALIFAPQKGATPAQVATLDNGLQHFAAILAQYGYADIATRSGAGAAGGLGAAILTLPHSQLMPGAEAVLDIAHFDSHLYNCDIVITGEGCIDRQTLMGKAPAAVLTHTRQHHIPTYAFAGRVCDREFLLTAGFADVVPISPDSLPLHEAMYLPTATKNLKKAIANLLSTNFNDIVANQ